MTRPDPSPLGPLPIKVRLFHGENSASFAHRLAEANSLTPEWIRKAAQSLGWPIPTLQKPSETLPLWRTLGGLHSAAFDYLQQDGSGPGAGRQLCLKCTAGRTAIGDPPGVGHVCIRHRRWFGEPQSNVHHLPEVIAAEKRWNRVLNHRQVHVFSRTFDLANRAAVRAVPESIWGDRQARSGFPAADRDLLVYPEAVKLACLITDTRFLDGAFLLAPPFIRQTFVQSSIIQALGFEEAWMATDPIWRVLSMMYARVGQARGSRSQPRPDDSPWDFFRHWDNCPGRVPKEGDALSA